MLFKLKTSKIKQYNTKKSSAGGMEGLGRRLSNNGLKIVFMLYLIFFVHD